MLSCYYKRKSGAKGFTAIVKVFLMSAYLPLQLYNGKKNYLFFAARFSKSEH